MMTRGLSNRKKSCLAVAANGIFHVRSLTQIKGSSFQYFSSLPPSHSFYPISLRVYIVVQHLMARATPWRRKIDIWLRYVVYNIYFSFFLFFENGIPKKKQLRARECFYVCIFLGILCILLDSVHVSLIFHSRSNNFSLSLQYAQYRTHTHTKLCIRF
jgi:hypothetical protein